MKNTERKGKDKASMRKTERGEKDKDRT